MVIVAVGEEEDKGEEGGYVDRKYGMWTAAAFEGESIGSFSQEADQ